jgi:hypothetical protein
MGTDRQAVNKYLLELRQKDFAGSVPHVTIAQTVAAAAFVGGNLRLPQVDNGNCRSTVIRR